jgi:hypothetical protein
VAEETVLIQAATRIAQAIHSYAKRKGWKPEDYHLFMVVKSTVYTLRITVYSKALEGQNDEETQEVYDEISEEIERQFPRNDRPFNYVGLIVTDNREWAMERSEARSQVEFEIDERSINGGVSWREPYGQGSR